MTADALVTATEIAPESPGTTITVSGHAAVFIVTAHLD